MWSLLVESHVDTQFRANLLSLVDHPEHRFSDVVLETHGSLQSSLLVHGSEQQQQSQQQHDEDMFEMSPSTVNFTM